MTYQLQYYKNLTHGDHTVRLNIYRKTEDDATPLFPTPLGDVIEGLEYGIQGRDGDFAPAIQKTSLTLTLVDAPEKNSVAQTWGGWEEFYTPDATMFRVDLLIDGALEWSGYVTPDSYEEDLTYHSAISITGQNPTPVFAALSIANSAIGNTDTACIYGTRLSMPMNIPNAIAAGKSIIR